MCGVVDLQGKFHPIAFMIANQETVYEFTQLFNALSKLADELGHEFAPEYVMMDAADSSYNATMNCFPDAKVLMCYFHVMKNVKANCEKPLSAERYEELLEDIRKIHMSKYTTDYDKQLLTFKDKWNMPATKDVYRYMCTWFSGGFCRWQIYHNPPGWASINSNIESFNATIKWG